MWCLKGNEDNYIYILPNHKKTFGKASQNDIILQGDNSISRTHAIVSVKLSKESEIQYECIITDISKYGTYLFRGEEKKRLPTNEEFTLKVGDKVQFGIRNNSFTVTHYSFITARSSLDEEEVEKLRNIMKSLNGELSENWKNSCTHLTVPKEVLFTTKLAYALASAKPIVTMAYWETIIKSIEEYKELPKIEDFLPIVKEKWMQPCLELLLPKKQRTILFRGLSFVHFCKKQYIACVPLISAAGGKSCLYPTRKSLTPRDLTARNAIVIQQPADSSQFTQILSGDYPIIYRKLKEHKRRIISDAEIPLAILHCSTEKYCNPKFNFGTFLKSNTQTFSSSDVVISEDSQETSIIDEKKIQNKKQQQIIPETCDSQSDNCVEPNICFPNKNEEKNISETSKSHSNIDTNIFSAESSKPNQIIPETFDSLDQNVTIDNFFGNNNAKSQIISESCKENITSNFSSEKSEQEKNILQQNIEIQQNNIIAETENNSIFEENSLPNNLTFKKNDLTPKKDVATIETNNIILEKKNLIPGEHNVWFNKDNSISQNDETGSRRCMNSKEPCTVLIGKIHNSNSKDHLDRAQRKTLKQNDSKIEDLQTLPLKKQKLNVLYNFENQRDNKTKKLVETENIDEKWKRKSKIKPTEWYEKFIQDSKDSGSTDEVLRKDLPCGKIFSKVPIHVPLKKLKIDDFI